MYDFITETLRQRSHARAALEGEASWEPLEEGFHSRDNITPSDIYLDPDTMTAKELEHASQGLRDMTTTLQHKKEYQ